MIKTIGVESTINYVHFDSTPRQSNSDKTDIYIQSISINLNRIMVTFFLFFISALSPDLNSLIIIRQAQISPLLTVGLGAINAIDKHRDKTS